MVTVTRDNDYNLHASWTWDGNDPSFASIVNLRSSPMHLSITGGAGISAIVFWSIGLCAIAAVGFAAGKPAGDKKPEHVAHKRTNTPRRN